MLGLNMCKNSKLSSMNCKKIAYKLNNVGMESLQANSCMA
jgi:hypothetical protein